MPDTLTRIFLDASLSDSPISTMPDKLMSLEEHNALISQQYHDPQANLPAKNGLACPSCGKELFDTTPNMILTGHPPKKAVHCRCGFRGWRNA